MKEKIKIKKNISKNLPYGSFTKIAAAFKRKTGKSISVKQVSNICNPENKAWNANVIAEAQELILAEKESISLALEKIT